MDPVISLHALVSSVGIGLLIGAVRERAENDPDKSMAGVRTHLLVALSGTLGAALGTPVLVAVLLLLGALMVVGYLRNSGGAGLTGEVTVPLTALIAALALSWPGFAAGIAVVVAAALYAKQPLHELVRERLSDAELRAGLVLAGAALVVLPLLPDAPVDPWNVLVPSKLWQLVVLILAVGMIGHVAQRVAGARWGLSVAGFFAGFASSTAAVAGFGQRVKEEPAHVGPAAAGALFANLGSLCLFAGIVGAGAPSLLRQTALPLAAAAVVLAVFAVLGALRQPRLQPRSDPGRSRVFHITHALLLVALMALLLVGSAIFQERVGSAGTLVAASAVAVVEVHAAAASITQMAAQQALPMAQATWGLVLLVLVSGTSKAALAFASGGAAYGWRVATGLAFAAAAMGVVMWLGSHIDAT